MESVQRTVSEEEVAEPTVTPPGTLGAVVSGPPPEPVQDPPLSLQFAGAPVPEETQPKTAVAPGASVPLYSRFLKV